MKTHSLGGSGIAVMLFRLVIEKTPPVNIDVHPEVGASLQFVSMT